MEADIRTGRSSIDIKSKRAMFGTVAFFSAVLAAAGSAKAAVIEVPSEPAYSGAGWGNKLVSPIRGVLHSAKITETSVVGAGADIVKAGLDIGDSLVAPIPILNSITKVATSGIKAGVDVGSGIAQGAIHTVHDVDDVKMDVLESGLNKAGNVAQVGVHLAEGAVKIGSNLVGNVAQLGTRLAAGGVGLASSAAGVGLSIAGGAAQVGSNLAGNAVQLGTRLATAGAGLALSAVEVGAGIAEGAAEVGSSVGGSVAQLGTKLATAGAGMTLAAAGVEPSHAASDAHLARLVVPEEPSNAPSVPSVAFISPRTV